MRNAQQAAAALMTSLMTFSSGGARLAEDRAEGERGLGRRPFVLLVATSILLVTVVLVDVFFSTTLKV